MEILISFKIVLKLVLGWVCFLIFLFSKREATANAALITLGLLLI